MFGLGEVEFTGEVGEIHFEDSGLGSEEEMENSGRNSGCIFEGLRGRRRGGYGGNC